MEKFLQGQNGSKEFVSNSTVYVIKSTKLKSNKHYMIIYEIVFKFVVKCVFPYILLISTNVLVLRAFLNYNYTLKNEEGDIENIEENNERVRKTSKDMRLHTNARGIYLRESQVNLGIFNLAIVGVFLACYSVICVWGIYDLIMLVNPSPKKVSLKNLILNQSME